MEKQINSSVEEDDGLTEQVPKISEITAVPIDLELQQKYSVRSLTEIALDSGRGGKICQLDNKSTYSAQILAEIRNSIDQTLIAVMVDNNFKDKSQSSWVKIYKTVTGAKTLVARFDPQTKVLHVDHHLTTEEVGTVPLNQEHDASLPASTTPLLVTFFRGLKEGSLFTEDTSNTQTIETLNAAWDANQFLTFVDHFDPDSAEASLTVLKATRGNITDTYFDTQAATTLDADHDGSYRYKDGTANSRERLIKVLSDLNNLNVPQTLRAIQVLENIQNPDQLTEALRTNNLQSAAELFAEFEKTLESTERIAENMKVNYDGKGNVIFNVISTAEKLDMAYLANILTKMHADKIGPNGLEYSLIVRDYGPVDASDPTGIHEYGAWLRTLHGGVDLNTSGLLLELLGIYGRSSARGNRNALSFITKQKLTFTLPGATTVLDDLKAGSRWRARNHRGFVVTIEMILDRNPATTEIDHYLGSRPQSVLKSRKISETDQERGVVFHTISSGNDAGTERVIKYLIYPPSQAPNAQFLSEIQKAGIVADLLWKEGKQLALIPETIELQIKPGFIGAVFEKVNMITNPTNTELGMDIVVDGKLQYSQLSASSLAMLAHLTDMRNVPKEILNTANVPVATEELYKKEVADLLAAMPPNLLTVELQQKIGQLQFHLEPNATVLVNGRTKPENMFSRDGRIGQTDWESIKQGHFFEDQVALMSNFLMMNPTDANRYSQGMNLDDQNVQFLFIHRALTALKYNLVKMQRLAQSADTKEVAITNVKVLIHTEIINWALSAEKNLQRLNQLSLELKKLILEHRPKSAHQISQLYGV